MFAFVYWDLIRGQHVNNIIAVCVCAFLYSFNFEIVLQCTTLNLRSTNHINSYGERNETIKDNKFLFIERDEWIFVVVFNDNGNVRKDVRNFTFLISFRTHLNILRCCARLHFRLIPNIMACKCKTRVINWQRDYNLILAGKSYVHFTQLQH